METVKKSAGRGGPGRGQGRKPADGASGLKRRNVTLDDASADVLRDLGDGDLSLGIRVAARMIKTLPIAYGDLLRLRQFCFAA